MIKALYALIIALPEILKLLETLEKRAKERAEKQKLKEDVAKIEAAFREKDEKALSNLFNS